MKKARVGQLEFSPDTMHVVSPETVLSNLRDQARRSPAVQETIQREYCRLASELRDRLADWPEELEAEVEAAKARLTQAQAALPPARDALREAEEELERARAQGNAAEAYRVERARQEARQALTAAEVDSRVAKNELQRARERLDATRRLLQVLDDAAE